MNLKKCQDATLDGVVVAVQATQTPPAGRDAHSPAAGSVGK